MFRRFATLLLLVPLSLNGLWMVCANDAPASLPAENSSDTAGAIPVCDKMCPVEKPAPGAICLISANGDGASIAAVLFAVAPPAAPATFAANFIVQKYTPEPTGVYSDPILSGLTPPPEA